MPKNGPIHTHSNSAVPEPKRAWVLQGGPKVFVAIAMSCALLRPTSAAAAESGDDALVLQEVVVTAQKKSENVQKVPISMTVITGDALAQEGVHDFNGILTQVPNLSFQYGTATSPQGMSSSRGITIRGIAGANTTSLYIDDTPVPTSLDPRILDVDHVEVLKGPQGTLYGEASMGGTVKIVTTQATSKSFFGEADQDFHDLDGGGFGTFDSLKVNVPLSTDSAMRLSGYYSYDPGFLTRTYDDPGAINGQYVSGPATTISHVGSNTSYGAMASFLLQPAQSAGLVIAPLFIAEHTHNNGFLATDYSTSNFIQRRALNVPEQWTDNFYLGALNVHLDSPIGKLTSSTSYSYRDSFDDEDGSDVTQQLFGLGTVVPAPSLSDYYQEQFTQEIRIESDFGGVLQTTGGLYFSDTLNTFDQSIIAPGANAASGGALGSDVGYQSHQPSRSSEKAIFISGTYSVSSRLKVTAGLRESFLQERNVNSTTGFYNGGSSAFDLGFKANALTPRFSAQYQLSDDKMAYLTAAKGFRPGGTQSLPDICAADLAAIGLRAGPATYNNDSLWNYEVGAKTQWFGGRAMMNIAAYDMEWKGIQQYVRLPTCGYTANVNGAAARSQGLELETSLVAAAGLTIGVTGGYEDAKITSVAQYSGSLYIGQPLNAVPKWTAAANAMYEYSTASLGRTFARLDYNYVGDSWSLNNSPVFGRIRPAYRLVDARIGTALNGLEVSLYAKNLLDSHPNFGDEVSEIVETIGRPRYVIGPPRSIGVELREKF